MILRKTIIPLLVTVVALTSHAQSTLTNMIDVDALLSHVPTASERSFIDSLIRIDTSTIDNLNSLPYGGGNLGPVQYVPVSTVKDRIYDLLLLMSQMSFSRPIPWTENTLFSWFISSCHTLTIVTNGLSEAGGSQIWISTPPNSYLLLASNWMDPASGGGLVDTMALLVHEARHCNGYGHTVGYQDATLSELGAWAAEYYFYKLVASYSNVTNAIMGYASTELMSDAQNLLSWAIIDPRLTLNVGSLHRQGDKVLINFRSPQPYSQHVLLFSGDLKSWSRVQTATFQVSGGDQVMATSINANPVGFYRVLLSAL